MGCFSVWHQTTTELEIQNCTSHIHDQCEFLYMQQGEADMQVGEKTYHLCPGHLLVISRLEVHELTPTRFPYTRIGLNVDYNGLNRIGIPPYLTSVMMSHGEDCCHLFDLRDCSRARRLLEEICLEKVESQYNKQEMMGTLFHALLLHLYRLHPEWFNAISGDTLMEEARQYITNHFADFSSVQQLAASYYLTPSHFILRFKKHTGYTPQKYRNLCRMSHARHLLMKDDISLSEIAEQCGFSDLNGFVRCFRETMNITPGRFRALSKSKNIES